MFKSIEEYLEFFKDKSVSIQMTIDNSERPTVHAFIKGKNEFKDLYKTESDSIVEALQLMVEKYHEVSEG